MKQTNSLKHTVKFEPTFGFSQREALINSEASKIMQVLRSRGFYPLGFEVINKNNSSATIVVEYNF